MNDLTVGGRRVGEGRVALEGVRVGVGVGAVKRRRTVVGDGLGGHLVGK